MPEKDQELPLPWHVIGTLKQIHFIEDFIAGMLMGTQEVVVSNPEGQVIVGTVDVVEPVCMTVRRLIGTVQPLDHLFERAVFGRNSIVVGKSNDLSDGKRKIFAKFLCKLHCGKGIDAIAIGNEFKVFRKLCKPPEGHAHGEDAGADATAVGYLVTEDGACGGIHDQPDISPDPADFDVSLIGCENRVFYVRVVVNEGLDADSSGLAVVGDLLMGDTDVVQVL